MATRKRKCVVLSVDNKIAILDRLKNGETQAKLAAEFGIGTSTLGFIKRDEAKIRSFASSMESMTISIKGRKVMRLASDEKLDEAVYQWFVQKRSVDMPVSGPVLCEKALQLHEQLYQGASNTPSFQASRGWLWHFRHRHGIKATFFMRRESLL